MHAPLDLSTTAAERPYALVLSSQRLAPVQPSQDVQAKLQPRVAHVAVLDAHADDQLVPLAHHSRRVLDGRVEEAHTRRHSKDGEGWAPLEEIEEGATP